MLDSTVRDCADDDARLRYEAQGREIEARLEELRSGRADESPKPSQIVTGLNMDHSAIWKLRDHAVKVLGVKAKDLDAAIRNERVRQAFGSVPRHPLEFVHLLAERRLYTVQADGTIVSPTGAERLDRIKLDARVEADSLYLNYSAGSVNDATEKWFYAAKKARHGEIVAAVSEPLGRDDAERIQAAFVDLCRLCFDLRETPALRSPSPHSRNTCSAH